MKTLLSFSFATLLFFLWTPFAYAEDVLVFHFSKENGTLSLDSQLSQAVVLENDPSFSVVAFSRDAVHGEYRIEFSDVTGASGVQYEFSGQEGRFSYTFPHFGIVNGYRVYSVKDNTLLFEGSLSSFVQCNANNVCEFEKGENLNTCLADCTSGNFSNETKKLLKQNNDVIRDPKSGEVLLRGIQAASVVSSGNTTQTNDKANAFLLIVGAVAVLLISAGVFVILRLRARNKQYGL